MKEILMMLYCILIVVNIDAQAPDQEVVDIGPLIGNIYRSWGSIQMYEEYNNEYYAIISYDQVLYIDYEYDVLPGKRSRIVEIFGPEITPSIEWYYEDVGSISSGGFQWSGGSDIWHWHKVDFLRYELYERIYQAESEDEIAYFADFLGIEIKSICVDIVDLYDDINGVVVGQLDQGHVVQIISEAPPASILKANEDQWVQICVQRLLRSVMMELTMISMVS